VEYIVLTGGNGFLGRNVVSRILSETDFGLILPVKVPSKSIQIDSSRGRIEIVDSQKLIEQCETLGVKIIGAIHTATEYGRQGNQIEAVLEANVALPVRILKLLSDHNAKFFINSESFFNKFPNSYPHFADYSNSKRALHYWFDEYLENLCISNLYLEHIYGPGDSIEKFVPKLLSDLRSQLVSPILLSNGDQKRDFVFVEDAAQAFVKAIYFSNSANFGLHNFEIGTGVATSIRDFVLSMKQATLSTNEITFGALPYRKDEIMVSVADTGKNQKLGWSSDVSLEVGISRLVELE
jgi:CDP-paratose synthetase